MRNVLTAAVLACVIENASAAEMAWPTPVAPVTAAPGPEWYPSRFQQQGIFFELGARYWLSSGRYSKDLFGGANAGLLSRLSYSGFASNAGELFGSVKQVDGYFLKWNLGLGKTLG